MFRALVVLALLLTIAVATVLSPAPARPNATPGFMVDRPDVLVRSYDLAGVADHLPSEYKTPSGQVIISKLLELPHAAIHRDIRLRRHRKDSGLPPQGRTPERHFGDRYLDVGTAGEHQRLERILRAVRATAGPSAAQVAAGLSQPIAQGSTTPTYEVSPIEKRLQTRFATPLTIRDTTLREAIRTLAKQADLNIEFAPAGYTTAYDVPTRGSGRDAGQVLSSLLADANRVGASFSWWVDGDRIIIGIYSDALRLMHTRLYDVRSVLGPADHPGVNRRGLTRKERAALILEDLITQVAPTTWMTDNGFENTELFELNGYIVVTHLFEVHQYVRLRIDELRTAAADGSAPELDPSPKP